MFTQKGVPMSDIEFFKKAMEIIYDGGAEPKLTVEQVAEIISSTIRESSSTL